VCGSRVMHFLHMQHGGIPSFWVHAESATLAKSDALYCTYDYLKDLANCVFDIFCISKY